MKFLSIPNSMSILQPTDIGGFRPPLSVRHKLTHRFDGSGQSRKIISDTPDIVSACRFQ